ncbi:TVP38/TMEM64 family protein [Planctomycetes bacterium TBK1r]|uniref:TVP38/TMEM64 family membrane protein n=1 Tax=Stieleria magnilauensis TaxID=2527963 RepID=A0ABX5XZU1_9BACT|nr:TVP38/TMEM64 family inner membrane protein YdjZ [Planctomycetes bacterium TBK1r]
MNQPETPDDASEKPSGSKWKLIAFAILAVVILSVGFLYRDVISLATLAQRESQLRAFQDQHPVAVYAIAFGVYVAVTGLSLPGAAALTLVYGWYFGFARALVLVSFASTAGATTAFLSSRYLLRDAVQSRYGESMKTFQKRLTEEGAFYLFTLRLIPAVPFFVINLVMGLTPIRVRTFWWVSQLGMLAGTAVYVYAGSRVPNLSVLAEAGVSAVIAPSQLLQLTVAFALLGIFPLAVRKILAAFRGPKVA